MADYCAKCGWPRDAHREAQRCPYTRKRRDGTWPTFTPTAPGGFPAIDERTTMDSEALRASEALSASGATAPRVSLDDMKAKIAEEHYVRLGDAIGGANLPLDHPAHLMTICVLTMRNGFVVIGKSAPASPENFDPEKGKTFAFEDAIKQLWPLEGYALREQLAA